MSISDATVSALIVGLRWANAEIITLRSGGLIPNKVPKPVDHWSLLSRLSPDGSDDPDYPWPKEGKT